MLHYNHVLRNILKPVGIHLTKYTVKSFLVSLEYYCGVDFIPLWQFLVSPAFVAFSLSFLLASESL